MAALFPPAKFQGFDGSGNPLSGGFLYTYVAGTTTPLATYTDSSGGTANANPVVLNSGGQADVWLSATSLYKLVLTNAGGTTIWTVDNVGGAVATTDFIALQIALQNSAYTTLTGVAGTNTITGTVAPAISSYAVGERFKFKPVNANTGAATLNVNGVGAGPVQLEGAPLTGGEIQSGIPTEVEVTALTPVFEIVSGSRRSAPFPGVVMVWVGASRWAVYNPDGSAVNISASTTSGLQEAINAACTPVGTPGYDLFVYGGDVGTGATPVISCSTPVIFPALQGKRIYFGAVTVSFTAAVTGNAFNFDSCEMVSFDFHGQIVYHGNNAAVLFNPNTPSPLDGNIAITDSRFFILTIATTGGTNPTGVLFQSVNAPILNSRFEFIEINGADGATVHGQHGLSILAPSGAGSGVIANFISCPDIHKFSGSGVRVGSGAAGDSSIYGNFFEAVIEPDGTSSIGAQVFGVDNDFQLALLNNQGTLATGIQLEASATKNSFRVVKNDATTKVVDNSTKKDNEGVYGNWYPRAGVDRNGANQTGFAGSTYTKVQFNHAVFDHGAAYDPTTNYRWTPGRIGLAQISARVAWSSMPGPGLAMFIAIHKNGAQLREVITVSGGAQADQGPMISELLPVTAATDYFEIWARQDSGTSLAIDGNAARSWASFQMVE